jgi:hypothetical protein
MEAVLSPWRVKRPRDWICKVKQPLSARELKRLQVSIQRSQLYGAGGWVQRKASKLNLEFTIRLEGLRRKSCESDTP